ncbi:hypothetical protein GALMADRAFT_254382 [Galerina marginata CBS 339.88]|uniref:Uncharacterized protein n=1 Tax=Galerina marginata (strain CBS 339.88) TaxID=685588 RepID=A0A067SMA0_GALM3|nr:hypothetical protein GALMADRAFT_254382 [Galerina marginata CBS 339.88]
MTLHLERERPGSSRSISRSSYLEFIASSLPHELTPLLTIPHPAEKNPNTPIPPLFHPEVGIQSTEVQRARVPNFKRYIHYS